MKKVVTGNELREYMREAISILCDTVKCTLGPKGNNVIVDHSSFTPFITNDGVTIASNIESDDEVVNTILTLAKEASIKTNEVVGDGTTTTLVLLESIFNEGLSLIDKGINPIAIKKELESSIKEIFPELEKLKRKPTEGDLKNIASISSSDEEIGSIISEVYKNVKSKSAIKIKEGGNITTVKYLNGYNFETITPSVYFFQDEKNIKYSDALVACINMYLDDINQVATFINECIKTNRPLVIIAEDYSDNFTNDILSLNFENKLSILLLKSPGYGLKKKSILKDIEAVCNLNIIENEEGIISNSIGIAPMIEVNQEIVKIYFKKSNIINERITKLKKELNEEVVEFEKEEYNTRLSMLSVGLAEISVGGVTTTEKREKKMRFDDALCAIEQASNGVVLGGGITYLKVAQKLKDDTMGNTIMKKALAKPFEQVLTNAGINYDNILKEIISSDFSKMYNVKTEEYENSVDTQVIDPLTVVETSLRNAVSIASMLLTTNCLVINEYKENHKKINDYNEEL